MKQDLLLHTSNTAPIDITAIGLNSALVQTRPGRWLH